jgi:hypothetical protein
LLEWLIEVCLVDGDSGYVLLELWSGAEGEEEGGWKGGIAR